MVEFISKLIHYIKAIFYIYIHNFVDARVAYL